MRWKPLPQIRKRKIMNNEKAIANLKAKIKIEQEEWQKLDDKLTAMEKKFNIPTA